MPWVESIISVSSWAAMAGCEIDLARIRKETLGV
jgi:hypothetical protein